MKMGHNPYFIGINLAISIPVVIDKGQKGSQSLFYWNKTCNLKQVNIIKIIYLRHNPYFIGINLAIIYIVYSTNI